MIYKIQVVTVSENGCQETLEIARVERTDLKPETLGLTLAEGKIILNDLQQIVVERQVSSSLLLKQACPDCVGDVAAKVITLSRSAPSSASSR